MFNFAQLNGGQVLLYSAVSILACLVILAVLHFVPRQGKKYLIVGLTFLAGLVYVVDFFWPVMPGAEGHWLTEKTEIIGQALQVIAGFTFLLGIYNLVHIHFNNVRRTRPNWGFSVIFFVFFVLMTVAAFWREWYVWFGPAAAQLTAGHLPPEFILDRNTLEPGLRTQLNLPPAPANFDPRYANDLYSYLFYGLYVNLEATMFSILAFYIVSAAYRAFRIRSAEAALMMITAIILMAGQVPLGMALTNAIDPQGPMSGLRIENFSYWVLSVVNMPVQRAIDFGLGIGALAMALRIWLSLERGTYFGEEA